MASQSFHLLGFVIPSLLNKKMKQPLPLFTSSLRLSQMANPTASCQPPIFQQSLLSFANTLFAKQMPFFLSKTVAFFSPLDYQYNQPFFSFHCFTPERLTLKHPSSGPFIAKTRDLLWSSKKRARVGESKSKLVHE